jgi:hypothetical protein
MLNVNQFKGRCFAFGSTCAPQKLDFLIDDFPNSRSLAVVKVIAKGKDNIILKRLFLLGFEFDYWVDNMASSLSFIYNC